MRAFLGFSIALLLSFPAAAQLLPSPFDLASVLSEYRETPGLALTVDQAQRLWMGDAVTCRPIVDVLVERHLLR